MNGCIITDTDIAVDYWHERGCEKRLHFLSHLHADHIVGLTPSFTQTIYCSPITRKLLIHKISALSGAIQELEVGETHMIPNLDQTGFISVTLLDANHCPGAVMFLFEGTFGTILHTGDFRYSPAMFSEDSMLSKTCQGKDINVLYLDNTYCTPECEFESREEAQCSIIEYIKKYPKHNVVIGMRNLGKETLLVNLALHFQTKIIVNESRLQQLCLMDLPDVFSTNEDEGFIKVVPFHTLANCKFQLDQFWDGRATIGVLPTALFKMKKRTHSKVKDNMYKLYVASYSDHSSYSELHSFVARISPRRVVPVVKENRNVLCFRKYLNVTASKSVGGKASTVPLPGIHSKRKQRKKRKVVSYFSKEIKQRKAGKGVVFDSSPESAESDPKSKTVEQVTVSSSLSEELSDGCAKFEAKPFSKSVKSYLLKVHKPISYSLQTKKTLKTSFPSRLAATSQSSVTKTEVHLKTPDQCLNESRKTKFNRLNIQRKYLPTKVMSQSFESASQTSNNQKQNKIESVKPIRRSPLTMENADVINLISSSDEEGSIDIPVVTVEGTEEDVGLDQAGFSMNAFFEASDINSDLEQK